MPVLDPAQPVITTTSGRPLRLVDGWRTDAAVAAETQLGSGVWRSVCVEALAGGGTLVPAQVRALLATSRLLHRRSHDGVVHVLDLATVDGMPALVTNRWTGAPFRALLVGVPMPAAAVCELGARVATLLAAVHRGAPSIVHGQLDASAVIVDDAGGVRLRGFGRSGPPGVTAGLQPADDVYALGALLYHALAGEALPSLPLDAEAHGAAVFDRVVALPLLPGSLVFLLAGCLAFDPADRPDAIDLAVSLSEAAAAAEGEGLQSWAPRAIALFRGEAEDVTAELAPIVEVVELEQTEQSEIIEPPVSTGPDDVYIEEDDSDDRTERVLDPVVPQVQEPLPSPVPARKPAPRSSRLPLVALAVVGLLGGSLGGWWVVSRRGGDDRAVRDAAARPDPRSAEAAVSVTPDPPPPPADPPPSADPTAASDPTLPALPSDMFEVLPPADERHKATAVVVPQGPPTRVVVRAAEATEVTVTCGDQAATGGTAASIRDLATTACAVEVRFGDDVRTANLDVTTHDPITCVRDGDEDLSCQ